MSRSVHLFDQMKSKTFDCRLIAENKMQDINDTIVVKYKLKKIL